MYRSASLSSDQNHYVVFIDDVDDPGYYILYDRVAKKAKQMPSQYTLLEGKTLGKIMSVEYPGPGWPDNTSLYHAAAGHQRA